MASATKAWTYGHEGYPAAVRFSSLPAPTGPPGPTELRIRVRAAALNPVDIQLMNLPIWPYLPTYFAPAEKGIGDDFSGVVETAGHDSGFKAGDEVLRYLSFSTVLLSDKVTGIRHNFHASDWYASGGHID
jgi:NADPH:quinone reductase-like Zn-dependent oxidoreductase